MVEEIVREPEDTAEDVDKGELVGVTTTELVNTTEILVL